MISILIFCCIFLYNHLRMTAMRIMFSQVNGNRPVFFNRNRNIKQNDRSLENGHSNKFLNKVTLGEHRPKPNQKQNHIDAVV